MPVQFAPKQGSFGQTLGNVVGGGLNTLIEGKIKELNKKQQVQDARKWVAQAQLPEWLGDAFVEDPKTFQKFLEQWEFLPPEAKEQVKLATENIGIDEQQQPVQPQQQSMMQAEQRTPMGQQAPAGVQVPAEDMGSKEPVMSGLNKLAQAGEGDQMPVDSGMQQVQSFPEKGHGIQGAAAPFESDQPSGWTPQEKARGFRQKPKGGTAARETATAIREAGVNERFAHKETSKYVNGIYDMEKAKNEEDSVLKRIIKVSEKDNARNPVLSGIMKQIGIDYQGLQNNDTLELGKLERWFLRGGVKMFGGRVSNAEMGVLLSQVPSMLQTKEGRIRLANQMLLANKDFHDEFETVHRIERENGGKAPLNIRFLVEEEMGPIREKNAEAFINGIYEGGNAFKVGQRTDDISKLPDGAEVSGPDGKDYIIKGGKPVLKG